MYRVVFGQLWMSERCQSSEQTVLSASCTITIMLAQSTVLCWNMLLCCMYHIMPKLCWHNSPRPKCFPLGMVAWLPCTSDFLRWPSYAMSLSLTYCLVWPTHICIPQHNYCNYIWLLPDPQCMEDIMFILRVGVVYSCSLYHI